MYCEYNSENLITVFKKLCSPWCFMKEIGNNLFTFLGFLFLSGLSSLNLGFLCIFIAMDISCVQTE